MATCIAYHESHYSRNAWSATGDHGVWQINYLAHHEQGETEASFHRRLWSYRANAREAFGISHGGRNWTAWAVYNQGLCYGL